MDFNINSILQNKGFLPNKEMSSSAFTAYNIDMFGKETIFDNLLVNNVKNTWFDKGYDQGGKPEFLIIKLGYAESFNGAKGFMNRFVSFIAPWISTKNSKPIEDSSLIRYHESMVNHIHKLQVFAMMMKYHFDTMNLGFGKYYIENFNFDDFINNIDFKNVLDLELAKEEVNIKNNIHEFIKYRDDLKKFRFKQNLDTTPKKIYKSKLIGNPEKLTRSEWNETIDKMIEDSEDSELTLLIDKYRK